MNPKTLRRLSILFVGLLIIVAIGSGLYAMNERSKAARMAAAREAGLAAFREGDHVTALEHLKQYVGRNRADAEAMFAYGTARSRIEEPNGKHIFEGVAVFRVVLELQPDHAGAKQALLELYPKAGYQAEAIDLADAVLRDDPENVTALRARALALTLQRKFQDAAVAYERLNEVAPHDLPGQLATYRVYKRIGKRPAEIVARAEAQRAAHPEDPRFELLLAVAYGEAGEDRKAVELLRTAAMRVPPDAQFVRELTAILDQSRMFDLSRDVLGRAIAAAPDDAGIRRVLVRRLWQNGRPEEVVSQLETLDPATDPKADTELLAMKALSLFELNRSAEAKPLVAALATRRADAPAIAWATALETRFAATPPLEPKAAIAKFHAALARDPDNATIRFWVGEAYEQLGEAEPAIEAWKKAAEAAPSWPRPPDRIARALAATGRAREAVDYARRARAAAPEKMYPAVTLAIVSYMSLDPAEAQDRRAVKPLLDLVTLIQQQAPGEAETLPIYVSLLTRTGERSRAETAARAALAKQPPLPQAALLRLKAVAQADKLSPELVADILNHAGRAAERLTPALALSRASDLAAAGRPNEGLALLEQAAKDAAAAAATQPATAPAEAPLQWELAIAQYREYTKDPAAPATWAALGDAHPDDLQVQTAVLKLGASARADRAFIGRTVERVRKITGDEGTLWKIERAKWLLGSDHQKDHSDAVNTLHDIARGSTLVEPRLLLAAALEKVENLPGAIRTLQEAAQLEPGSPVIALELARLLQAQGQWAEARVQLDRVVRMEGEQLGAGTRRSVAAMYAAGGDAALAIDLLAAASSAGELDNGGELLLADLYRRQGRAPDAEAVYARLLARPAVEPEAVAAAADFYAVHERMPEARAVLARLDAARLRPGLRERVLAAFEEKHGSPAEALEQYRSATVAAPADADAWRELVSHLLRARRAGEARAAAEEAVAAVPHDERLQTLRLYATTAAQAAEATADTSAKGAGVDEIDLQPLIDELANDPGHARAAAAAQILQDERSGKLTPEQALAKFRQLADRNPRYKRVQIELVRRYLAHGNLTEAALIAARTMDAFPTDPEAARLAVAVFRRSGQWDRVHAAARQWRQRSLEQPLEPDWAIAEAKRHLGDIDGALAQIAPHVDAARRNPERLAPVLATAARLYAADGRETEARGLLAGLLPHSAAWRTTWLTIARTDVKDADAAVAWVDQATPHIPADAVSERLALAGTWHALGSRHGLPRAWDEVRKIAVELAEQPGGGSADAAFLLASIDDATGRLKEAEANYRRALAADPQHPESLNNLAYLLATRGTPEQAVEARELAARAVQIAPNVASFHDTLARAHLRAGEREEALKHFVRALELDPVSLEALIGKATALSTLGRQDQARELLHTIDLLLKGRPPLPDELKRELDATRASANAA